MNSVMPWAAWMFMMCHRMGRPPISTIGFGRSTVSSDSREPRPPARMTALIFVLLFSEIYVAIRAVICSVHTSGGFKGDVWLVLGAPLHQRAHDAWNRVGVIAARRVGPRMVDDMKPDRVPLVAMQDVGLE